MKDRLNIIFKPFFLSLLILLFGYTFLHWLLFIKFDIFNIKEVIVNFGIPFLITGLVSWFYLRPKLKILKLKTSNGTLADVYTLIAWLAFTIPLIISQQYIITASGELTKLGSISEINKSAPTKYYSLKTHYINKNYTSVYLDAEVGGKNNENFGMYIYATIPIFEKASDTVNTIPSAWLAIKYSKTVSNRLEPNEKQNKFREFTNESEINFKNKNISEFIYLDRIGKSEEKDGFSTAIKNNKHFKSKLNVPILVGVNEPFESLNGDKLNSLIRASLIGTLIWLIIIFIPKIDQRELNRIKAGKPDRKAQREVKEFLDFLIPKEGFFITLILIYINIAVFLLMFIMGLGFISFKGQDLLQWGANFGPLTKNGEYWRLITNIFLHGGLMHLLANMYGLLFVGIFLEPLLGRKYFIIIYLLTGILASITSLFWYDATVSIGASGAIFGLYGLFISFMIFKVFSPEFSKAFLLSTVLFVGFNLLMGLTGGIDNAAHIGGLLSGFLIGIIMILFMKKEVNSKENK